MQVVIDSPRLDRAPRVIDRQELVRVQALVAQFAVERYDGPVFRSLSPPDEVEGDPTAVGSSRDDLRSCGPDVAEERTMAMRQYPCPPPQWTLQR